MNRIDAIENGMTTKFIVPMTAPNEVEPKQSAVSVIHSG